MGIVQANMAANKPVVQQESLMDKILKGVQLANSIVGTVGNVQDLMARPEQAKAAAEQAALQRKAQETDIAYKTAQMGEIGKKEEMSPYQSAQIDIEKRKLAQSGQQLSSPAGRLAKMGGETQNKVGSIASGLRALDQIDKAMGAGQEVQRIDANTSIIGGLMSDTDISSGQRTLSEVVGRLQSGGAINDDEGKRFIAMGPRPGDTREIAAQKIGDQRAFLENKLAAFQLKADDLPGLDFQTTSPLQGKGLSALIKEEKAGPRTETASVDPNVQQGAAAELAKRRANARPR